MRPLCVALGVLVCVSLTRALDILSSRPTTEVLAGRILQNQTLNVRCRTADAGVDVYHTVISPLGLTHTVRIRCSALRYVYELQRIAVSPISGRLNTVRICRVRTGSKGVNNSQAVGEILSSLSINASTPTSDSLVYPTARRLLVVAPNSSAILPPPLGNLDTDACFRDRSMNVDQVTFVDSCLARAIFTTSEAAGLLRSSRCNDFGTFLSGLARSAECQALNGDRQCTQEQLDRLCDNDATPSDVDFRAQQASALRFQNYLKALQTWGSAVEDSLEGLQENDRQSRALIEANFESNRLLLLTYGNETAALKARLIQDALLAKGKFESIVAQYNARKGIGEANIATFNTQMTANVNRFDQFFRWLYSNETARLYRSFDNLTATTGDRFDAFETSFNAMAERLRTQDRAGYRFLRRLTRLLITLAERRDALTDMVRLVRRSIRDELVAGRHPFLRDIGADPIVTGATARFVSVETVRIAYLRDIGGGVMQARMRQLTLYANALYVSGLLTGDVPWDEILEDFGPTGCDTLGMEKCALYALSEERACVFNVSRAGHPIWNLSLGLDATVCESGYSESAPVLMTNVTRLMVELRDLCGALALGTGTRIGAVNLKRFYSVAANLTACSATLEDMQQLTRLDHPLVGVLGFWEAGMARLATVADGVFSHVVGVLPSGLDYEDEAFAREANQSARCLSASYMSYPQGRNLESVYRLNLVSVLATAEVQINGGETRTLAAERIGADAEGLLPAVGELVFGDPRNSTLIYDVPTRNLRWSLEESGRRGGVLYAAVPLGTPWTATDWTASTGQRFAHSEARAMPSVFRVGVHAASGICDSQTRTAFMGPWCVRRDAFVVSRHPENTTRLEFTPRTNGFFELPIRVPLGDVTLQLATGCPSVSYVGQSNGVTVNILNPFRDEATRTQLLFIYVAYGAVCADRFDPLRIVGGSNSSYFVARCPGADRTELTLYRVDSLLQQGEVCPNADTIDLLPEMERHGTLYGGSSVEVVNRTTVLTSDAVLLRIQETSGQMFDVQLAFAEGLVKGLVDAGLDLPTGAYDGFFNVSSNATVAEWVYVAPEYRPGFDIQFDGTDFERASEAYRRARDRIREAGDAALNRTKAAFAQARAQIDVTRQSILRLVNASNQLDRAAYYYTESYIADTQATMRMISSINQRVSYGSSVTVTGRRLPLGSEIEYLAFAANLSIGLQAVIDSNSSEGQRLVAGIDAALQVALEEELGAYSRPTAWYLSFIAIVLCSALLSFALSVNAAHSNNPCSWAVCYKWECCQGKNARRYASVDS